LSMSALAEQGPSVAVEDELAILIICIDCLVTRIV